MFRTNNSIIIKNIFILTNSKIKNLKADPFNDVTNIHSNPASDSSTNIYHANENIIKKSFDSTGDNQAIILNPLPKDSLSKNNLTLLQNPSKKESELPQIKNKNWFFDVYISPDLPFTKITSGNANFLQLIKESNKMQMSYTIGAKISRSFAKYFIAELGFQYSQINAKFHDSISIINRYRSIDIPLLIGYAIKNSRFKTTINTTINAGLIFNLYSWYKG